MENTGPLLPAVRTTTYAPAVVVTNQITRSSYRLVLGPADTWRITKTFRDEQGNATAMRHLRGRTVVGVETSAEVLGRLVKGLHQVETERIAGDPWIVMATAALMDFSRTSELLISLAQQAIERFESGAPGFRPRCKELRKQAEETKEMAIERHRELVREWMESGLVEVLNPCIKVIPKRSTAP